MRHEQQIAWGLENGPKLVAILKKMLPIFLPKEKLEDNLMVENVGEDDLSIMVGQSGFSLDLADFGSREVEPVWQLTAYITHPATREQPEDIEDCPVSYHKNNYDAATTLIKTIFEQHLNGWAESEAEAEQLQWDNDHADEIAEAIAIPDSGCPHGNDPAECNDCMVASDQAYDAYRRSHERS